MVHGCGTDEVECANSRLFKTGSSAVGPTCQGSPSTVLGTLHCTRGRRLRPSDTALQILISERSLAFTIQTTGKLLFI